MITRNINDDNTLAYLFQKSGKEAGKVAGEVKAELEAFKAAFADMVYPVGSIYMSVNSASPETLFGGRWERITGRFLLGATDGGAAGGNSNASIAPGNTGGEATHALTTDETATKNHSHSFSATFQLRHGNNAGTDTAAAGTNTTVTRAGGSATWGNGWSGSGYSHKLDLVKISGSTGGQTGANGTAHNNMPPYLAVYIWKRTA